MSEPRVNARDDALPYALVTAESSSAAQAPRVRRRTRLAFVALTVALAAASGALWRFAGPSSAPSPPAETGARPIVGLARLTPEGEVRTLAPPFGAGDAALAELLAAEGQRVEVGAPLARFDNLPALRSALAAAEAALAVQAAGLAQTRALIAASRAEAEAALARAEAAAEAAARDYDRAEALSRRGVAADATLDQRRSARDQAQRETERARAALTRFDGPLDRQTDVLLAQRRLESARADVDRARADLEKGVLRAPISGVVLAIHARAGEKPGARGVLDMADIDRMRAEAEIHQSQIGRVRLGARVEIDADAFAAPLRGEVTRIGLDVARQTLVDPSPAANTDARVVRTWVALDTESARRARAFTNMQAVARIDAGEMR